MSSIDNMDSMANKDPMDLGRWTIWARCVALPVRTWTWLPVAAVLTLTAVTDLPTAAATPSGCLPPWVLQRPAVPAGFPVDPPIDTAEACPAWRWVALKRSPEAPCPAPATAYDEVLRHGHLFGTHDPAVLPPALRPFCLYQVATGGAADRETLDRARQALEESLERLLRRGELREVESGCAAVGPSAAGTADDAVWPLLRDHFLAQAGVRRQVTATLAASGAPPRVRLALLDTQPSGDGREQGRSEHGFTLGRMARRLVCEDAAGGRCAAQVVQRLALPISEFAWDDPSDTTFDWEDGGYFGTIDQLAQGVWRELEAWGEEGEREQQEHLVLNLSVAWVGERFGGLERRVKRMPVPVQALYRALQVASCRGALVVAAAGNRIGGPEVETGPLLPGGWERRRAPTPEECAALLGEAVLEASERGEPPAEPLLYAAAGIQADGAPLVNARPASEPPRVAYADHAVVAPGEGDPPPAILTGSSVATTVVASAAAVVWHHRPELSRAEVMELLQRSGEPLGRPADVHLGLPASEVRRLAVCPALALACGAGDGHCPAASTIACQAPDRQLPELSRLRLGCTVVDLAAAARADAAALTGTAEGNGFCQTRTLRFAGDAPPGDPCPFRQFFALRARPWTGPQPQNDPCSGCDIRPAPPPPDDGGLLRSAEAGSGAESGYLLRIDIDPDWNGGPLEAATLRLGDTGFALGLPPLEAGDCAVVEGLGSELLAPDAQGRRPPAVLHFRTADGSVESPLVVGR